MNSYLTIFGITSLIELLIWLKPIWGIKKYIAIFVIIAQSIVLGLYFGKYTDLFSALLIVLSTYRVMNLLRLIEGRHDKDYLYKVSFKSSLSLILMQVALLIAKAFISYEKISTSWLFSIANGLVLGLILFGALIIHRHLQKANSYKIKEDIISTDLPTLTVAIPARNETEDLVSCLESLVASDYSKLEIIVLDDCSQEKRTPQIIRSFAHSGITFISGEQPKLSWLAKNYAYEQLYNESNGDIILFCGVDTIFDRNTLKDLVSIFEHKKLDMMSVAPVNKLVNLKSSIIQPVRYSLEFILPNLFNKYPPSLSTCWLIKKDELKKLGSFSAIKSSVFPEKHFAKHVLKYDFIKSSSKLNLVSQKDFSEQKDTALRTLYPIFHRRPQSVCLNNLFICYIAIFPFFSLIYGLVNSNFFIIICSVACVLALTYLYFRVFKSTFSSVRLSYIATWPFIAIYCLYLENLSMWRYEFREVFWKGRNICMPIYNDYLSR